MRTWKRRYVLLLAAVPALVLLLVGAGLAWTVGEEVAVARSCPDQWAADRAKVRTDREWIDENVPELGGHLGAHWQIDAAGNPCSRAPGPTEWRYQGVVRLSPAAARSLATAYPWRPAPAGEPAVWPGLAPHVPAGVSWRHRPDHDQVSVGGRHARLYLDPDRAVVLFLLWDS